MRLKLEKNLHQKQCFGAVLPDDNCGQVLHDVVCMRTHEQFFHLFLINVYF
jgi:hypothetical protein